MPSVVEDQTRAMVIAKVTETYGPDMAGYVEQSMATDPDSPFVTMITDAIAARTAIEEGRVDDAVVIVRTYRTMASSVGLEPMFDALMESLGIPLGIDR